MERHNKKKKKLSCPINVSVATLELSYRDLTVKRVSLEIFDIRNRGYR